MALPIDVLEFSNKVMEIADPTDCKHKQHKCHKNQTGKHLVKLIILIIPGQLIKSFEQFDIARYNQDTNKASNEYQNLKHCTTPITAH